MSGRMDWDRVGRESRAWRAARQAPSGRWEPGDSWEPYNQPEVDRWLRADIERQRLETEDKTSAIPWGMGIGKAAHQRRRRRKRTETERRHAAPNPATLATAKIERALLARWDELFIQTDAPIRRLAS
jgi:hypothetical protein